MCSISITHFLFCRRNGCFCCTQLASDAPAQSKCLQSNWPSPISRDVIKLFCHQNHISGKSRPLWPLSFWNLWMSHKLSTLLYHSDSPVSLQKPKQKSHPRSRVKLLILITSLLSLYEMSTLSFYLQSKGIRKGSVIEYMVLNSELQ